MPSLHTPPQPIVVKDSFPYCFQGSNSNFVYTLHDPSGTFALDPATGLLSIDNPSNLDHERVTKLELEIGVREVGSRTDSARGSKVMVTINVGDANDNAPVFRPGLCLSKLSQLLSITRTLTGPLYTFTIPPDPSQDLVVGFIRAADPDAGDNGKVQFDTRPGGTGSGIFSLDPLSGEIRLVDRDALLRSGQRR